MSILKYVQPVQRNGLPNPEGSLSFENRRAAAATPFSHENFPILAFISSEILWYAPHLFPTDSAAASCWMCSCGPYGSRGQYGQELEKPLNELEIFAVAVLPRNLIRK